MPVKYECSYFATPKAKRRFKIWLMDNELSITQFAAKCGVSRQYISSVIDGKIHVTPTVIATFKKGGYEII